MLKHAKTQLPMKITLNQVLDDIDWQLNNQKPMFNEKMKLQWTIPLPIVANFWLEVIQAELEKAGYDVEFTESNYPNETSAYGFPVYTYSGSVMVSMFCNSVKIHGNEIELDN